ncbi:BTBDH protein, partial [Polyodon spathula]|nr:BTB/POZ domain-containing protein 17-like [Polyodon spathula]MBN3282175.1 BTBDH protein [Polyodon spathula]
MLSSEQWPDSQEKSVALTEEELCVPHFEDFLRYFYTGTITIVSDNAVPIHMLANKYNVSNLRSSVENFMLTNLSLKGNPNPALQWKRYARLADVTGLEEACDNFIAWNMDQFMGSPEWTETEHDHLLALLQRSDLVVESEMTLLIGVINWIDHHPNQTEEILKHIRYPMIPPQDLFQYQPSEIKDQDVRSYILSQGLMAYHVNSVPIDVIKQRYDITSVAFTQRLYTSKTNGSPFKVTEYSNKDKDSCHISLSTKHFQQMFNWSINFYPKGQRPSFMMKDDNRAKVTCQLFNYVSAEQKYKHKLCILLMKFVDEVWCVRDVKTFSVVPFNQTVIDDLIPLSARGQYVCNDTMKLHFIGETFPETDDNEFLQPAKKLCFG